MTENRRHIKKLYETLFSMPKTYVYALLDGASIGGDDLLLRLDEYDAKSFCLYQGNLPHDVEAAAPYLVRLEEESAFTQWILENGWGNHWGIFAVSSKKVKAVRKHFRTMIKVKDPEGKTLFFRYYDPRVFKVFLPTCSQEELAAVFGPVHCYLQEGDSLNHLIRFTWNDGDDLKIEDMALY